MLKNTALQASINAQTNSYDFEKSFREEINWQEVYSDGIQLHLPFDGRHYVLIDGSMLLTRDKEQAWKEVLLSL